MNNHFNKVDMSTFIENGRILIKNKRRFMVFDDNGKFIGEVTFNNSNC